MATSIMTSSPSSPSSVSMQQQQSTKLLSMIQNENQSLKQSLARIQSEYEELEQDSKFHQAKVAELSELIMGRNTLFKKNDHTAAQQALIQISTQNAELNLQIDQLKAHIKENETEMETLSREKQQSKRLLLEMSDIVRTLQSVQIAYDASSIDNKNDASYVGAQQLSIQKIKLKIEAIMSDRSLLVRRCKELETELEEHQEKIQALESQYHNINNMNMLKKGGIDPTNDDAGTEATATSYTISTKRSGNSPIVSPLHHPRHSPEHEEDESMNSGMDNNTNNAPNVEELRELHEEHVQRLQKENERVYEQMDALKEQLRATKEQMQDAVIKRDEYKETLRDIITQYKQLHAEHESAGVQMKELQNQVDQLKHALSKKESESVKQEEKTCTAIVPASQNVNDDEEEASPLSGAPEDEATEDPTRLQDVIKAYSRAMEKIASLENRLGCSRRGS